MKKTITVIAFLLALLSLASCHKDKEFGNEKPEISEVEVSPTLNHADFTWKVEYPGKFQTGVEISDNEALDNSHTVEGSKAKDAVTYKANVDGLEPNTAYYYRFVVWNKISKQEGEVKSFTTATPYIVTVSANPVLGGTVIGGGEYVAGSTCTVKAIANEDYTFVNWTENNVQVSGEAEYAFKVTGNRNLAANFSSQEYIIQVEVDPEEGGTVEGAGGYNLNDECTLTATANEGYDFVNWTKEDTEISTEPSITFTVAESATYVAHFQKRFCTIEVSANPEEGGTVTGGGTFQYGDLCEVKAVSNEGYNFVNWTEDNGQVSGEAEYSFTVTCNRQLVANFTSQAYLIQARIEPEEGGTVEGAGGYDYGQECTLKATPNEGYGFLNWTTGDGTEVSTNATYRFTVTESATYVAHFQKQSYTIEVSANPEEGGTVSGGGTFYYGENRTLTATANLGYDFDHWTKNGTTINGGATINFTVTASANYVAYFTPQTYTITTQSSPSNCGSVSGGGDYTYHQSCTLTATANMGYDFDHWTRNGATISGGAVITFYVTESATYVAYFTPQPQAPMGAINGLFTINEQGGRVFFSQGNLQYIGSATTPYWKLADNQWVVLGDNGQASDSQIVDRDLFGWGTSGYHDASDPYNVNYQPWATSTDEVNATYNKYGYGPSTNMPSPHLTGSSANYDWGVFNPISNGGNITNTWRTLTGGAYGEWSYVFFNRNASTVNGVANARYAKAKVANVQGVILFPDNYAHPSEVMQPVGINDSDGTGWNGNDYSAVDFLLMEANGAVFLPAAGYRDGTPVLDVDSYGYYWSVSSSGSSSAYCVHFSSGNLVPSHYYSRYHGRSVRLVYPVQ